jgi:hypothetical protein
VTQLERLGFNGYRSLREHIRGPHGDPYKRQTKCDEHFVPIMDAACDRDRRAAPPPPPPPPGMGTPEAECMAASPEATVRSVSRAVHQRSVRGLNAVMRPFQTARHSSPTYRVNQTINLRRQRVLMTARPIVRR